MKLLLLLITILPLSVNAQTICIERFGEGLEVESIAGDTVTIIGQEFGIASGHDLVYRYVVYRDGQLHGVYLGMDDNPFLRILLSPGSYRVIRYSDYYSPAGQTGITESKVVEFCLLPPVEYSE